MAKVKAQMISVIEAIQAVANVRRVNFLPAITVVELVYVDGREYPDHSLPSTVASVAPTYHHHSLPFFDQMKNHKREGLLDPEPYLPGPLIGLSPRMWLTTWTNPSGVFQAWNADLNKDLTSGPYTDAVILSTSGVRLRKNAVERITVANHGLLTEEEVFHPREYGVKIGDVEERYDELDIAMVRLVPSQSSNYSNNAYFQEKPPRQLVTADELEVKSYFDIEGMSTSLITLPFPMETPVRSPGHPPIPVLHWENYSIMEMF